MMSASPAIRNRAGVNVQAGYAIIYLNVIGATTTPSTRAYISRREMVACRADAGGADAGGADFRRKVAASSRHDSTARLAYQ